MVFGTADLSLSDGGVQQRIANTTAVSEHPHFDTYTGANDLSIIELDRPVTITSKGEMITILMTFYFILMSPGLISEQVIPVALPRHSFIGTTFNGFKADVIGWGDPQSWWHFGN